MLKDSGIILLTEDDLKEYRDSRVSERLREVWGISSFEELKEIIEKKNYKVIHGSETRRPEETS